MYTFKSKFMIKFILVSAVLLCALNIQPLLSQEATVPGQLQPADTLLVDADGFRLYLLRKGNHPGPVVIMENGLCGNADRWNHLDDSIAVNHTVITYNRAFIGKSEKGNPDRKADIVVNELKSALNNAGISGPFILIGYSMGGYYSKAFARSFSDEVKGVFLIDPLNTAEFYKEYKQSFALSYELESSSLKNLTEAHPCYYEIRFALDESLYGNDAVPPHIPTYMLISALEQDTASLLQSYEQEQLIDKEKVIQENIEIQKTWVKHQLKWASSFPNVKTLVTNECTHGMHHECFDLVWDAFVELRDKVNK